MQCIMGRFRKQRLNQFNLKLFQFYSSSGTSKKKHVYFNDDSEVVLVFLYQTGLDKINV